MSLGVPLSIELLLEATEIDDILRLLKHRVFDISSKVTRKVGQISANTSPNSVAKYLKSLDENLDQDELFDRIVNFFNTSELLDDLKDLSKEYNDTFPPLVLKINDLRSEIRSLISLLELYGEQQKDNNYLVSPDNLEKAQGTFSHALHNLIYGDKLMQEIDLCPPVDSSFEFSIQSQADYMVFSFTKDHSLNKSVSIMIDTKIFSSLSDSEIYLVDSPSLSKYQNLDDNQNLYLCFNRAGLLLNSSDGFIVLSQAFIGQMQALKNNPVAVENFTVLLDGCTNKCRAEIQIVVYLIKHIAAFQLSQKEENFYRPQDYLKALKQALKHCVDYRFISPCFLNYVTFVPAV